MLLHDRQFWNHLRCARWGCAAAICSEKRAAAAKRPAFILTNNITILQKVVDSFPSDLMSSVQGGWLYRPAVWLASVLVSKGPKYSKNQEQWKAKGTMLIYVEQGRQQKQSDGTYGWLCRFVPRILGERQRAALSLFRVWNARVVRHSGSWNVRPKK